VEETPSSEAGSWQKMFINLARKVPPSQSTGILTCHKILWYVADGFTPPQKKVVWIFIALKNQLSLTGFEPMNLGSNGKHNNH
jgi:hypothetical protein